LRYWQQPWQQNYTGIEMTTTLKAIRRHKPCSHGWTKLLKHLNKTKPDDEPLSLLTVLESNGLYDAIWCLCTEPTPERTQRFALAVARRVEHLSPAAKACNDTAERYLNGLATKAKLRDARHTAQAAADASADEASYAAAYAANAANAAANATNAADFAATNAAADYAADNAASAATNAAKAAGYAAANTAAYAAERQAQEQLFREIFA
jgi:chemotaxis protein histidine kinase CheA